LQGTHCRYEAFVDYMNGHSNQPGVVERVPAAVLPSLALLDGHAARRRPPGWLLWPFM